MLEEKVKKIQSLNKPQTEILHRLIRDPKFKVNHLVETSGIPEKTIRGNLSAIFRKLEVPSDVSNKREWVFREYREAYIYVFFRDKWEARQAKLRAASQPEMHIKPPAPIIVEVKPSRSTATPVSEGRLEGRGSLETNKIIHRFPLISSRTRLLILLGISMFINAVLIAFSYLLYIRLYGLP